jgi:hypothetical protein
MPNWCSNTIEIQGTKEQITKFVSFLEEKNGKEWFDFFIPTPTELKEEGWYEWNVQNWGTKWNCDAQDWMKVENPNENESSVTFWFDSAWAPPIALYEYIESNTQLNITASYHEEGMTFVGEFKNGSDDYYEYTDIESLEDIPEHIVDEWNLVELLEDREGFEDE